MKDGIKLYGSLKLVISKQGESDKVIENKNLVVTGGLQKLLSILASSSSRPVLTHVKVGDSSTAPSLSQTDLVGTNKYQTTVAFSNVDTYRVRGFFVIPFNQFNGKTIREFGLFSSDGKLFSRALMGPIAKDSSMQISGYWDLSSQPLTTYSITVNTGVTAAVITLNGAQKTGASVVFSSLSPGSYELVASAPNYVTQTKTLVVVNSNLTENISFVAVGYELTVEMSPDWGTISGAVLTINGSDHTQVLATKIVVSSIPNGVYPFTLVAPQYQTVTGSITVSGNTTVTKSLVRVRYNVTFNVTPADASNTVTVNGSTLSTNSSGALVISNLLPGTYQYTVKRTGYTDATGSAIVSTANVTKNVSLTIKTFATQINLSPTGGTLTVSGTGGGTFNNAASMSLNLSYGTHTWSYSKSEYVTKSGSWTVSAESTKTITLEPATVYYNVAITVAPLGGRMVFDGAVTDPVLGATTSYTKSNGTYSFSYTKSGYYASTVTQVVVNGVNQTVSVTLQPLPSYTVSFNINGGTGTTPAQLTGLVNTTYTMPGYSAFTKAGYRFLEWEKGGVSGTGTKVNPGDVQTFTSNTTWYAKWEAVEYKVTFNVTTLNGILTFDGETINPVVTSQVVFDRLSGVYSWTYTRSGYYPISGNVTVQNSNAAVTLTLALIPVYTITFNLNGASGTAPSSLSGESGTTYRLPIPTGWSKPGYLFIAWAKGSVSGASSLPETVHTYEANVTWYALFELIKYPVTLSLNPTGGRFYFGATDLVEHNVSTPLVVEPGPYNWRYIKAGYVDKVGTVTVTGNTTLSITLDALYYVSFNANGASGTLQIKGSDYAGISGETYILPESTGWTKAGFRFKAWARGSVSGITAPPGATQYFNSNVIWYALWEVDVYEVTLVLYPSGGDFLIGKGSEPVQIETSNPFLRAPGTYNWGYSKTGYAPQTGTFNLSSNMTLTIDLIPYLPPVGTMQVLFDLNGGDGTVPAPRYFEEYGTTKLPSYIVGSTYNLTGWILNTPDYGGLTFLPGETVEVIANATYFAKYYN